MKKQHQTTSTEYFKNYYDEYERLILTKEGSRFSANDRYLLENGQFRLYYTSQCEESQNFIVVVEDNFGKSCELEFDFQHDNGGTGETEDDGKQFPYVRPLDSLVIAKPRL